MAKTRPKPTGKTKTATTSAATAERVLRALYGEWATSPLIALIEEALTLGPIFKGLSSLRDLDADAARGAEAQIENFGQRLAALALREGPGIFSRLARANEFVGALNGRAADPLRSLLITGCEVLHAWHERRPTVGELREWTMEGYGDVLERMEDSQFRRTCRTLGLTFTDARKLGRLHSEHRRWMNKHGGARPKHREFWRLAKEKRLLFSELPRSEFVRRCLRSVLEFPPRPKLRV